MTAKKRTTRPLPDATRLRALFRYEPETGLLIRIAKSGNNGTIGEVVGGRNSSGYLAIGVDGVRYLIHRIAFKMMTGEDLKRGEELDHVNGDRGDNSWNNLRVVSRVENSRNMQRKKNNTSGVTGVSWAKDRGKWAAYIMVNRKKINLGHFTKLEAAIAARKAAEEFYGFHSSHDRDPIPFDKMRKTDLKGKPRIGAGLNQSGIPGITWAKANNDWQVRFMVDKVETFVGHFDTVEEAARALEAAKRRAGVL